MLFSGTYPSSRLRRTRQFPWIRNLVREVKLSKDDFIWAVFITEGENIREPLHALQDVFVYSIDILTQELQNLCDFGLCAIMLFPRTDQNLKSEKAEESYNPNNLICRAIRAIKKALPKLGVMADVALDPYTTHGHDGLIDENGYVMNDETIEILCLQSLVQAEAGCDVIAPSDMMDGRVGKIRSALDAKGFENIMIMSYAIKFSSCFYNPFRDSIKSTQKQPVNKATYQTDPANTREALREVAQDIGEGADMIIIKPALFYLDIIQRVRQISPIPIIAYHVSGEYAMIKSGIAYKVFDKSSVQKEAFLAMKRAGADAIITYNFLELRDLNLI